MNDKFHANNEMMPIHQAIAELHRLIETLEAQVEAGLYPCQTDLKPEMAEVLIPEPILDPKV